MNINAKIEDFLNPDELEDLAKYLKRITYEDAYNRSDPGDYAGMPEGEEWRKAQAYRFLSAVGKLENYLAEIGF
jgi:hypothetical protein